MDERFRLHIIHATRHVQRTLAACVAFAQRQRFSCVSIDADQVAGSHLREPMCVDAIEVAVLIVVRDLLVQHVIAERALAKGCLIQVTHELRLGRVQAHQLVSVNRFR